MLIGRQKECEFLKRKLNSEKSELLIIYGRRRVGKTYLLQNCVENSLFFTADLSNSYHLMNRFAQEIKDILKLPASLKISTWDEFFQLLKNVFESKKNLNTVVFDEFQYLHIVDESFMSILQRWWDEEFSKLNVKFILCGSHKGMIEKVALSQNSPLYGRRTGQYQILPLDFFESTKFLNFENLEDYVRTFSVTDGIPLYLLEFSGYTDFKKALCEKMLTAGEYLLEEGKFLTIEEFKEPSNYFAILQTIAEGRTTPNEIADISGVDYKTLNVYLSKLVELKLVEKELPFHISKKSKQKPRYYISDEYLKFYFRYLHRYKDIIYRGLRKETLDRILNTFDQHVSFTFEKIAQQYMLRKFNLEKVGRWWHKNIEIDLVGFKENTLYVGECKWTNKKVDKRVLNNLRSKVPYLLNELGVEDISIVYCLFSKSGFEGIEESEDTLLIELDDIFALKE